jgi:hypothetical protein
MQMRLLFVTWNVTNKNMLQGHTSINVEQIKIKRCNFFINIFFGVLIESSIHNGSRKINPQ